MGIADLIYSLSLVDGGIESLSNGTLTSATDAMFHLMSDAYEKLSSPIGNGGRYEQANNCRPASADFTL
jgi:hypothetical protein